MKKSEVRQMVKEEMLKEKLPDIKVSGNHLAIIRALAKKGIDDKKVIVKILSSLIEKLR